MGNRKWFAGVGLAWTLGLCVPAWTATLPDAMLPPIEIEYENGIEVHYVDIGRGNTFGVSFYSPFGTMHDQYDRMGLSHAKEHVMFAGTDRHHGQSVLDKKMRDAGVNWNARTTETHTYFFAYGRADHARLMIDGHFSMLGGLEFDARTFEKEISVVVNEVAMELNKSEADALHLMVFDKLMPEGHPWRHPRLGTGPSLTALTLDHVKQSYYRAISPRHVRAAVYGNFGDPAYKAQVKEWVRTYLKPARVEDDPHGFVMGRVPGPTLEAPSFTNGDNPRAVSGRRLDVQTDYTNSGVITFELERAKVDLNALALLINYLNLPVEGGLLRELRKDRGLILAGAFSHATLGAYVHLSFAYTPSRAGLKARGVIERRAIAAIRDARAGVDAEAIERIKRRLHRDLARAGRTVPDFIDFYEAAMDDPRPLAEMLDEYDRVTPAQVAAVATLIDPERAVYTEANPVVNGGIIDPVYGRAFKVKNNTKRLESLVNTMRAAPVRRPTPRFPEVLLPARPAGEFSEEFRQTIGQPELNERFVLDFRKDLPDRAVQVQYEVSPRGPKDLIAIDLVNAAFNARYAEEMNDLRNRYNLAFWSGRTNHILKLATAGLGDRAARAAEWLLKAYQDFRPSKNELEVAREVLVVGMQRGFAGSFTANQAVQDAHLMFDRTSISMPETIAALRSMGPSTVRRIWARVTSGARLTIGMVGDFTAADYEALRPVARGVIPGNLDAAADQRNEVIKAWIPTDWITETQRFNKELPFPKADLYGLVRMYRGPILGNLKESMAFQVLNHVLSTIIFSRLRSDLGLGYVHESQTAPIDFKHNFLTLEGQVDAVEHTRTVERVWDELLDLLRTGQITDDDLRAGIASVRDNLRAERLTSEQFIMSYLSGQRARLDARVRERMLEATTNLEPARVREVAWRYVLAPDVPFVQVTYGDCEKLLALSSQP